jgi:hypothetical protein
MNPSRPLTSGRDGPVTTAWDAQKERDDAGKTVINKKKKREKSPWQSSRFDLHLCLADDDEPVDFCGSYFVTYCYSCCDYWMESFPSECRAHSFAKAWECECRSPTAETFVRYQTGI